MDNPLVLGRRPCMWCEMLHVTASQCECGAAICPPHIEEHGPLCPLCVRLGRSRYVVVFPIDWSDTDKSTVPLVEVGQPTKLRIGNA